MMNNQRKILNFSLLIAVSLAVTCKKDKATAEIPVADLPPVVIIEKKALIPAQLGTGKSSIIFSYTTDQSLLKAEYADGTSVLLTYDKKGIPTRFERYDNKILLATSQYKLDDQQRMIRANLFTITKGLYVQAGYYTLAYHTDGKIAGVSYYDKNNQLTEQQQRVISSSGNLIQEISNSSGFKAEYNYDTKNGLFKNVNYAWLFALEKENPLFLSEVNNIQKCSYSPATESGQSFSYVYNAQNYPETIKTTVNGVTTSAKVIYKSLE